MPRLTSPPLTFSNGSKLVWTAETNMVDMLVICVQGPPKHFSTDIKLHLHKNSSFHNIYTPAYFKNNEIFVTFNHFTGISLRLWEPLVDVTCQKSGQCFVLWCHGVNMQSWPWTWTLFDTVVGIRCVCGRGFMTAVGFWVTLRAHLLSYIM